MQPSNEQQYKKIMMERLVEENQKVRKLKSEVQSKFYEICNSKISKESKIEILDELKKYFESGMTWINNSSEIKF